MEFGKIEKFDKSRIKRPEYGKPGLSAKVMELGAGQSFDVKGVSDRATIASQISYLGKREGRKFSLRKVGHMHYIIARLS
jgi:hypothetical protein